MSLPAAAHAAPGDVEVTVSLADSAGNPLDGGTASYYSTGWHTLPDPTTGGVTTVELPPGTYSFAMVYRGTRVTRSGVVVSGATTVVPFQTTRVTASLTDSNGDPLDGGGASYYAGGWYSMGTTTSGTTAAEMLAGTYSFAMTYRGTRAQRDNVVVSGTTTDVPFQTTQVTVSLLRSLDDAPVSGGAVSYYAGGWRTVGTTPASGAVTSELLPGSYPFSMNYSGTTQQQTATVAADAPNLVVFYTDLVAPTITSGPPPRAAAGEAYSFTVTATGNPVPRFAVSAGALPDGLSLNPTTGEITGTATHTGAFTFTITASNHVAPDAKATYTMDVGTAPTITSGPPPAATAGEAYEFTVTATGDPAPRLAVSAGALPDGLSLNPTTGEITGTPTHTGTFTFTITASNHVAPDATASYTLRVKDAPIITSPPAITSGRPPAATAGAAYSFTVTATGDPAPRFTVTAGALPDGLSLNPTTGEITGTPTHTGTFTFTITASNGVAPDATANYALNVRAAPVTPPSPPLPATGTSGLQTIGSVGVASILAGLWMLMVGRRGRRSRPAPVARR